MGFLQSYIGTPFTTRAILELFSHQELYWNSRFLQSYIGTLFYHLSYIGTLTLFSPRVLLKLKVSSSELYYILYIIICYIETQGVFFLQSYVGTSFQPLELYWNSTLMSFLQSYIGTLFNH